MFELCDDVVILLFCRLKEKARQDFIELLLENPDLFQRVDPNKFTNEDLKDITDKLTFEPR